MYLILSNVDGNATSSRAFEVFHDGVDVTRLRVIGEGPPEKRSFTGEEKVHRRREGPNREG